jgi:hypothetical protein
MRSTPILKPELQAPPPSHLRASASKPGPRFELVRIDPLVDREVLEARILWRTCGVLRNARTRKFRLGPSDHRAFPQLMHGESVELTGSEPVGPLVAKDAVKPV